MFNNANLNKFGRDLLVIVASAVLLYVGEHTVDLGLPDEFTPLVSAMALGVYRLIRSRVQN
jgi:hypothetical protein